MEDLVVAVSDAKTLKNPKTKQKKKKKMAHARKGRMKVNVAGERYDSNAIPLNMIPQTQTTFTRPATSFPEECRTWQILYPNYIDSTKTIPQGRKIGKEASCESPLPLEMAEVCKFLKLSAAIETSKAYPRDWLVPGRLRVKLKDADGNPIHPEIRSRKQLLRKMGELIPKLQIRKDRLAKEAALKAGSGKSASGSGGKKKGKKKGRR